MTTSARRETGVAMLEVLIAILIMSFGLLGVAGMQLVGMRSSNTAHLRSVATFQAYDIADRMRANMTAVRDTNASNNYSSISCATTYSSPSCAGPFGAAGCTPTEMRNYDAAAWCTTNASLLPGGGGTVSNVANSNAFQITITWTERCQTGETGCSAGVYTRTFNTQFVP